MMADYSNYEVNEYLTGDIPTFPTSKDKSNYNFMIPAASGPSSSLEYFPSNINKMYDNSGGLSVEAKAFRPNPLNSKGIMSQIPISTLNISDAEGALHHLHPNPSAREFVPRSTSNINPSPNLKLNSSFHEFHPNKPRPSDLSPQSQFYTSSNNQFSIGLQRPEIGLTTSSGVRSHQQLPISSSQDFMQEIPVSNISYRNLSKHPFNQSTNNSNHYCTTESTNQPTNKNKANYSRTIHSGIEMNFQPSLNERSSPANRRFTSTSAPTPPVNNNHSEMGDIGSHSKINIDESNRHLLPVTHENGGTTYFFTDKTTNNISTPSMVTPSFNIYPGSHPQIDYMPSSCSSSFFVNSEYRKVILDRSRIAMARLNPEEESNLPSEVENYHNLFPLEAQPANLQKHSFGYVTTCYKALQIKDGRLYCLRRVHGFRQINEKSMRFAEMWKNLHLANVVQLREIFTTKAFGELSLVFVHDYYPGAESLLNHHFRNNYKNKWNGGSHRSNGGFLNESLIWSYIVQLTSALRSIHSAGLACRVIDLSKILVTDKSRLRINGAGISDILSFDAQNPTSQIQQCQQEDLVSLGKVILALACNTLNISSLQKCTEHVHIHYSVDLKNLILYLLNQPQNRSLSVNEVMPMIGARFYTSLDTAMLRCDTIESELEKEIENGRLYRLIIKLSVINERPEFDGDAKWSETGDRYLLKLFRDYVFHSVTESGNPFIDISHITDCLNKLDAGTSERLCLMSRDELNVLVVSYADLKKAFTKCFSELLQNSSFLGQR